MVGQLTILPRIVLGGGTSGAKKQVAFRISGRFLYLMNYVALVGTSRAEKQAVFRSRRIVCEIC